MGTEWVDGCTFSDACVQVAEWRTASNGGSGGCVEAGESSDGLIAIRESERPDEVIVTSREKFAVFLRGAKDGVFDDLIA